MSKLTPAPAESHDGNLARPIILASRLLQGQKPRRRVAVPSHATRIAADVAAGRRTKWTPDTLSEAWQELCWRSPWARILNDLGGVLLISALILFVIYALISPAGG